VLYLGLFVPFGIFFTGDGLPQPYAKVFGVLILLGSWLIGRLVASFWAPLLPLLPWATAVILIYATPEGGEESRAGAAILWSFVFALLTALVIVGVFWGRRTSGGRP